MPDATAVGSLVVLGVFSTAIAFLAFFILIAEAGPGRASVITYVNPAVAVLLGVLILHEQLGPRIVHRAGADPRRLGGSRPAGVSRACGDW